MKSERNWDEVLNLAKRDDPVAIRALYDRFFKVISDNACKGIFGLPPHVAREIADEAAHDAFLTAWNSIRKIVDICHFEAWLRRAARHRVLNELRARKTQKRNQGVPHFELTGNETDRADAPLDAAEKRELLEQLHQRARLSEVAIEVLMRRSNGEKSKEIAHDMGLTECNVNTIAKRSLDALSAAWKEIKEEDGHV